MKHELPKVFHFVYFLYYLQQKNYIFEIPFKYNALYSFRTIFSSLLYFHLTINRILRCKICLVFNGYIFVTVHILIFVTDSFPSKALIGPFAKKVYN